MDRKMWLIRFEEFYRTLIIRSIHKLARKNNGFIHCTTVSSHLIVRAAVLEQGS